MSIPKHERKFWVDRGFKDPLVAFRSHKYSAAQRGIEFLLTPYEWWELWAPHYHQRGTKKGGMVMCRHGDVGPYAKWNVRIAACTENLREAHLVRNRIKFADDWGDNAQASDWLDGQTHKFAPDAVLIRAEGLDMSDQEA